MKSFSKSVVFNLIFVLGLATGIHATDSNANEESKSKVRGHNALFMGHSFFWPSARQFEKIVSETKVKGHKQALVRAGGRRGSPAALWSDKKKRAEAQKVLDTKKVDLVVMTFFSPFDSSVGAYSKWIDYALTKNKETSFMIAVSWNTNLHRANEKKLAADKATAKIVYDMVIVKLREKYPKTKILYCPYGLGTYELIDRLNAGKLPGVKHILNADKKGRSQSKRNKDQLLNDELGHAGELVTTVATLMWLQTIYDYDLSTLPTKKVVGLPKINCAEIAATVCKQVRPYNKVYAQQKNDESSKAAAGEKNLP